MLSPKEFDVLVKIAESITGNSRGLDSKQSLLTNNVQRLMRRYKTPTFAEFLDLLEKNNDAWEDFVSAITIHTTSWFREYPHFERLEEYLRANGKNYSFARPFRLLSAACSTGQEVYSFALVLERFRKMNKHFDYRVEGFDIDPVSVRKAQNALYLKTEFQGQLTKYKDMALMGSDEYEKYFTFDQEVLYRCSFNLKNLKRLNLIKLDHKYDWIVCRNVLIYFDPNDVKNIAHNLSEALVEGGILCLGHSEIIEIGKSKLQSVGRSCYQKYDKAPTKNVSHKPRILILDDDKTFLERAKDLFKDGPYEAVLFDNLGDADEYLENNYCDMLVLDVYLQNSIIDEWVHCLRRNDHKEPIILISSSKPENTKVILDLLEDSAQDFVEKKDLIEDPTQLTKKIENLLGTATKEEQKKESAIKKKNRQRLSRPDIILIGASTGGTNALTTLLKDVPKPCPPIVVVQHITNEFLDSFAQRLSSVSGLKLGDARHGEPLKPNTLYMARGDHHIGLLRRDRSAVIKLSNEPPRKSHRPSVDVLFETACDLDRRVNLAAFILTGMGADGANGMLKLKETLPNTVTYAESEESCVVYGMPKEAIARGCVDNVGSLDQLRIDLINSIIATQMREAA